MKSEKVTIFKIRQNYNYKRAKYQHWSRNKRHKDN
uniref:Uncharacterized protein n=1 Tax=Setaria italica TaxID=4555 RepID=K3ZPA6_SETIT